MVDDSFLTLMQLVANFCLYKMVQKTWKMIHLSVLKESYPHLKLPFTNIV